MLPSRRHLRVFDDRNRDIAETDGRPGQTQPGTWGAIEELAFWAEQHSGDDAAAKARDALDDLDEATSLIGRTLEEVGK